MVKKLKLLTGVDLFNYFEIDPEIQTRYLLNVVNFNRGTLEKITGENLIRVLLDSFIWSKTTERHFYWQNIMNTIPK